MFKIWLATERASTSDDAPALPVRPNYPRGPHLNDGIALHRYRVVAFYYTWPALIPTLAVQVNLTSITPPSRDLWTDEGLDQHIKEHREPPKHAPTAPCLYILVRPILGPTVAVTRTPVCQCSIQGFVLFVIAPMSIGECGKPYLLFRHFLQAHCCPLTSFLFQMAHLKSLSESSCQNPALSATTSSRLGEVNPLPLLLRCHARRAFLFAGHGTRVNVMLHARAACVRWSSSIDSY